MINRNNRNNRNNRSVKYVYSGNPNETKENGVTSLIKAVKYNLELDVKYLCENFPNLVNKIDIFGNSPLLYAVKNGNLNIVNLLCEHFAELENYGNILYETDINNSRFRVNKSHVWPIDKVYHTPLTLAVKNKNVEIVNLLLDKGANINFQLPGTGRREKGLQGFDALYYAAINLDVDMVQLLLNRGADPTQKYKVCQMDYTCISQYLLLEEENYRTIPANFFDIHRQLLPQFRIYLLLNNPRNRPNEIISKNK